LNKRSNVEAAALNLPRVGLSNLNGVLLGGTGIGELKPFLVMSEAFTVTYVEVIPRHRDAARRLLRGVQT
jgi:hypothetical protein